MELKLHLNHEIRTDIVLHSPAERQRFVVCWMPDDKTYATYSVDAAGNCYWGHYGFVTLAIANADLLRRTGLIYDYELTVALEATNA